MKKTLTALFCLMVFAQFSPKTLALTTADNITLPTPVVTGGMPIMDALKNRQTNIKFSKTPLPLQMLSDLLWAADGVNRSDGKHTASSASSIRTITVYAVLPEAIYKYDPQANSLMAFSKEDVRPIIGAYPLILLYTGNLNGQSKYLAAVECGFIGQNVYLYSAANNLNSMFLYNINNAALYSKLDLKLGEEVLFAQVVGFRPDAKK